MTPLPDTLLEAVAAAAVREGLADAIFTRLNRPLRILAKVTLPTRSAALRAEYAFKQASRADKLEWCATGLERFIAGP